MNFNNDAQVWLKRSEVINVSVISLRSTVWRSSLSLLRAESKADWDEPRSGTRHLSPSPLFTLLNVWERSCLCVIGLVCVCVCLPVCVWLSSVCSKPPRPTLLLPRMPLNPLQSLHHRHHFIYIPTALFEEYLRWGNLFSECPSYRFTQTPMGLKSCSRTPGEAFSPNETKINRTVLSSHI